MARPPPRWCWACCRHSRWRGRCSAISSRVSPSAAPKAEPSQETFMRSRFIAIAFALVGVAAAVLLARPPAHRARPYEGQTIRAVVNAEYVKYSLSLIEQDLYDKLGVKLETEVIPLDPFVSKTRLELNGGGSPCDSIRFGPHRLPD